jgi:hypothetical protein
LVEIAPRFVLSKDSNISPWGRGPVGVVVTLLRAFVTVSVSVVLLTSEDSRTSSGVQVALFFSVRDPETEVAVTGLAVLVVGIAFVHAELQISVFIDLQRSGLVIGDGVGSGTITNSDHWRIVLKSTHVLEDNVAVQVGIITTS